MRETLEQLVARVNANAYLPNAAPTAARKGAKMGVIKLRKGQEFTFAKASGGGVETQYPWDQWFDGELWLLERSEGPENEKGTIETPTVKKDFGVPVNAMPAKLKTAARRRYKVVQMSRMDTRVNPPQKIGNGLFIKARDMTDEERQAEDLLRAEEKAELQAKKAAKKTPSTNGTAATDAPSASEPAVA